MLVMTALWLAGCASLPSEVNRPVTQALTNPESTRLGALVQARAAKAGLGRVGG